MKNEDAHKTFGEAYDAMLIIKSIPKKIEKSLSKMKVKLDIALNAENATRTINLHTDESAPKYMLNFVKQTLEKIT